MYIYICAHRMKCRFSLSLFLHHQMGITCEFNNDKHVTCSGRNHGTPAPKEFKWADFFGRQISQQPLCLMGVATLLLDR